MSDDETADRSAPEADVVIRDIPADSIQRWTAIPAEAAIEINISRGEFDHLYFALQAMQTAQIDTLTTIELLSKGKADEANVMYNRSAESLVTSMNRLSAFMDAVMRKTETAHG